MSLLIGLFSFASFSAFPAGARAATILVNAGAPGPAHDGRTWTTAFLSLGTGLGAAVPGDEVWVAQARYTERVTLKSGVAVYGGFRGTETGRDQRDAQESPFTLDASGMPSASAVTVPAGAGPDTLLEGAMIFGALAPWTTDDRGGGVYCQDASPTLRHLTIYSCRANGGGGGIYIQGGSPVIEECSIEGNNAFYGGGIYVRDATDVRITRCTLRGNDASYLELNAGSGGGIYAENVTGLSVRDSLITGNRGFTGAGVSLKATTGEVVNCTIHDNGVNGASGAGAGEGARLNGAGVTFANTIITAGYGATSVVWVESNPPGGLSFDHCDVFGRGIPAFEGIASPAGQDGNLSADPGFSDINGVAYHLGVASSCRDAGASGRVLPGETDRDGFDRLTGAAVDIGAFEYRTEATRLFFSVPPGSGLTGRPLDPQPVIFATNPSGEVVPSFTGPVTLSPGLATPALSGTVTVPAVNGEAAFSDVAVEPVGRAYSLVASSGALAPARSAAFHVGLPRVYLIPGPPDSYNGYDGGSWSTPKYTLQSAVDATGPGGEVWVRKGSAWQAWASFCGVALYGGFDGTETERSQRRPEVNTTILDGAALDIAASYGYPTAAPTVVDGFQIQGGTNVAIRIGREGRPPVGAVEIAHNRLSGSGGGIEANSGVLNVRDNLFVSFRDLDYERVALLWRGATTGQAVNNTFVNGHTGISIDGPALLANNVVAFNTIGIAAGPGATDPGAVGVTLRHNDIYGNTTDVKGLSQSPIGRDGNISADPLFAASGNYRPVFRSPLINAGDASLMSEGERDLDGQPRAAGGGVDIGAYEYVPPPFTLLNVSRVLRISTGRTSATEDDLRFDVAPGPGLDLLDAARLARKVAGLEPNP